MSKIKVNLASGNVIEKPLISCFKGTNGDYVILDGEANGQMGYPIVCISRFNANKFEKIVDPGEWGSVKENLKAIISGTSLPYLNVPETVSAADDFYTQLTLPVASFDLLKSVYAPVKEEVAPTPAPEVAPAPAVATINPIAEPVALTNDLVNPVAPAPQINIAPAPISEVELAPAPAIATPAPEVAPAVESTPAPSVNTSSVDVASLKASFMQSCENMFDALVKKFENK